MARSTSRASVSLVKLKLLDLLATILQQLQRMDCELWAPSPSMVQYSCATNAPIFLLALADHAQRRASCTRPADSPRRTFFHNSGREIEADQIVERAACLLGVDEIERQSARLPDRRADGVRVIS